MEIETKSWNFLDQSHVKPFPLLSEQSFKFCVHPYWASLSLFFFFSVCVHVYNSQGECGKVKPVSTERIRDRGARTISDCHLHDSCRLHSMSSAGCSEHVVSSFSAPSTRSLTMPNGTVGLEVSDLEGNYLQPMSSLCLTVHGPRGRCKIWAA